jgi:hypothetical protein
MMNLILEFSTFSERPQNISIIKLALDDDRYTFFHTTMCHLCDLFYDVLRALLLLKSSRFSLKTEQKRRNEHIKKSTEIKTNGLTKKFHLSSRFIGVGHKFYLINLLATCDGR